MKQRGNRDKWRSVVDGMENGGESEGENGGVAEKGQSRTEFVGDPSVIQYLTPMTFHLWLQNQFHRDCIQFLLYILSWE